MEASKMKKILLILLVAIISISGLLFYNNTYAKTISGGIVNVQGIRGFTTYSQGQATYYGNQTWAEGWTIPSVILGSSGQWQKIYLNGIAYSVPNINLGDNSKKFNKYNFIINFKQQAYQGQPWTFQMHIPFYMSYVLTDGTSGEIQCKIGNYSSSEIEWNCGLSTDNYAIIKDISIDWGAWKTIGSNPTEYYIAEIYSSATPPGTNVNANSIILQAWAYNVESTDDPMIAGQNTIINQNNTIINQNQQIIDAQNQTNQWLQDTTPPSVDTSSLNTSVGWMPAGPVDSILTLPLQLLQGIVNVFTNTNCTPLRVPVPYVNEDITLPCVSTLMDDIGFTPVWSIVGGVISAVIIWDTLKWLYRFVDDTLTFRENNSGMWGGL